MSFQRTDLRHRINTITGWKVLLGLCSFFFAWRLIALEFFEKSGDAVWKWSFLRYFHETGIWYPSFPDHHQGRWAQNMPVLGFMEIFGAQPWVYYILPLLTGFGVSLLCYWIATRLSDRFSGVLAFLTPMFFVHVVNESNQLLPMLPAAFWVLAATALCFKYFDTKKHLGLFYLAGIALGFAWGCKVTSAYWCVGFGLFLLFTDIPGKVLFRLGKIRVGWDLILLTLGFFTVFIPETLLLNHFFEVRGGRLSMLFAKHLGGPAPTERIASLAEYIFSFLVPMKFQGKGINFLPKVIYFATGIAVMFLWRQRKRDSVYHRFLVFTFFAAYLLQSYVIIGIDPIRYPEKPLGRYFLTLSVFSLIATTAGWQDLKTFLHAKIPRRKGARVLIATLTTLCILLLSGHPINETIFHNNNLSRIVHAEKSMNIVRAMNLPVLAILHNDHQSFEEREIDQKVARLWFAFWGPTEEIPQVFTQTPLNLVHDSAGRAYNYLWGGTAPAPGEKRQCAVVSELDIRIAELRF
ncbi:MAG: hypothetical protein GXY54_01975 [Deltaproteobacteria bacterium]|nr:hypothetical protein [Deltaproteobacteria bacterium]